jgi:hypothetical protein
VGFQTSELPLNFLEPFKKGIDSATDSIQFALVTPWVRLVGYAISWSREQPKGGSPLYDRYKKNHISRDVEKLEFY